MAGADRVEGTLLGNGERAGNVDILNLALNLYTQGIDPELDLSNLPGICRIVQECTKMEISKRHPYAGQLIFTAFSGSHQDAVNKGFENQHDKDNDSLWEMPYIPIDPCDIGRSNVQIIRITSQSGKGGTAYVVKHALGYELPKMMHADFAKYIQKLTEETGREVTEQQIVNEFQQIYLGRKRPFEFISYQRIQNQNDISINIVLIKYKGKCLKIQINESDTFETYIKSLNCEGILLEFISEQSLPHGSCHEFVSYTKLKDKINGKMSFGVGIDATISIASIKAIMSGLNNLDN
jgi:2-isopropylmalate synthase